MDVLLLFHNRLWKCRCDNSATTFRGRGDGSLCQREPVTNAHRIWSAGQLSWQHPHHNSSCKGIFSIFSKTIYMLLIWYSFKVSSSKKWFFGVFGSRVSSNQAISFYITLYSPNHNGIFQTQPFVVYLCTVILNNLIIESGTQFQFDGEPYQVCRDATSLKGGPKGFQVGSRYCQPSLFEKVFASNPMQSTFAVSCSPSDVSGTRSPWVEVMIKTINEKIGQTTLNWCHQLFGLLLLC